MPIYEFYCADCHTIYSFLSRGVNTDGRPACPHCRRRHLSRQVSRFAVTGRAKGGEGAEGGEDVPLDEARMEQAMEVLARDAENINEDDPRQAAGLMRRLSEMTGMEYGEGMQEALSRMEAGEDPEAIEREMGDLLDGEDALMPGQPRGQRLARASRPAARDEELYEM